MKVAKLTWGFALIVAPFLVGLPILDKRLESIHLERLARLDSMDQKLLVFDKINAIMKHRRDTLERIIARMAKSPRYF